MLRRYFIGSCAAGILAGGVSRAKGDGQADDLSRLLTLASVVAPDDDSSLWVDGEPARRLRQAWPDLSAEERGRLTGLLDSLDSAAGGSFGVLGAPERIRALDAFLGKPPAWPASFRTARTLIVRAFYDSPSGFTRTGYIPATQFAGYPQLRSYPAGRGGS
jgi:hypothetical protein